MNEEPDRPPNDEIAALAQEYWETEGKPEGKAEEHWHRAAEELRRRRRAGSTGQNPA